MRLIDADALLKASRIGKILYFNDTATDGYTDVLLALEVERATTIEAEPVQHGKWSFAGDNVIQCALWRRIFYYSSTEKLLPQLRFEDGRRYR